MQSSCTGMPNYLKLLARLRAEGKPIGRDKVKATEWVEPVAKVQPNKQKTKAKPTTQNKDKVVKSSAFFDTKPKEDELRDKFEEEKRKKMTDMMAAKCRLDYVKTAEGRKA